MRAGPSGEQRGTPHYTVPISLQCPQEISLLTLPVLQGTAVSSEHFTQSLLPGNVAELRGSPPLRGSLERPSPAGPPLQGTELAALSTPEASFERLVPLVDYLSVCKLLLNVSRWVMHTVEQGNRGALPPSFNGVTPTLVGPEQAPVMEQEVSTLLRKEAIEVVLPLDKFLHCSWERGCVLFRSKLTEPLSDLSDLSSESSLQARVSHQIRGLVVTSDLEDAYSSRFSLRSGESEKACHSLSSSFKYCWV